jgi:purine-nucleoside phosphorylase
MNVHEKNVLEATKFVKNKINSHPKIAIILGSGLGSFADTLDKLLKIPTKDIPHYPVSTVEGHEGNLVFGEISGKEVVCIQGRTHLYEGYSPEIATFSIRILQKLNIENLIVTNAAGGISSYLKPADLMLISDHINFMFTNPLIGKNADKFGERFPDMSEAYSKKLLDLAEKTAINLGISIKKGVYAAVKGPSYETPSEVKMLEKFGANAVGMSTTPDNIIARHAKMDVLGISCITNFAAGISSEKLDHSEVTEVANKVKADFENLLKKIVQKM